MMKIIHCKDCKHIKRERGVKCEAFPKAIPFAIQSGEFNHRKKFPNQKNDIVFEPKEA